MHPRVSLHQVAFLDEPTEAFLDHCRRIGVENVSLISSSLARSGEYDVARSAVDGGGPRVSALNHPFAVYPDLAQDTGSAVENLVAAIDLADGLGAPLVYLITGGRGTLNWEQAAGRFADLISQCAGHAAARGVALLVENASAFNADIHFVHTLADAITVAEVADVGLCIELHACWCEGGLAALLDKALPRTRLIQVSDYVLGDRSAPCRAVPGDGAIPLQDILAQLISAGYAGVFDVELVGPRIMAEGAREATERGARHLSNLLTRLGA
ncbi:sugar phosphate isomerase/epimerase [Mycobacterium yunnanensis]|uniref:Sugar phosphate isomerase/epimerase n=1 Tax=Mycobacterium yunnanensis TaxID=368477 RepID=A0A9X2YPL5_9MYCO|nr:sugar phosphate isomerase/epimerase [Mycobacterium yunnanensis]MCV7423118.1 sugar phosphate isomerase/epimerase [Mycobacterium yunnanensis]